MPTNLYTIMLRYICLVSLLGLVSKARTHTRTHTRGRPNTEGIPHSSRRNSIEDISINLLRISLHLLLQSLTIYVIRIRICYSIFISKAQTWRARVPWNEASPAHVRVGARSKPMQRACMRSARRTACPLGDRA